MAKQKNTCLFIIDKEPKKIISFTSATSTVNLIWNDPYIFNLKLLIYSFYELLGFSNMYVFKAINLRIYNSIATFLFYSNFSIPKFPSLLMFIKLQKFKGVFYPRWSEKSNFFFFNIYDVDNEFYENEEGAKYGPEIAD